ncbi:MAG: hypothetical protein Q9185_001486 [Variospora sp. 1 TL-2023]
MPAASSFADGGFMSHAIHLNAVNEQLQWNPHSRDREAVQNLLWDRGSLEPPQTQASLLSSAIHSVEFYARRLAKHPDGRLILTNENPGQGRLNPRYWFARAAFYKAEFERLEREDQERPSRSVTPGCVHPDFFGDSELDRAKGHAENAAFRLASLPEGKAFLDTEDHGAFAGDPDYWRQKEKEYHQKYSILPKESALDRARRHADTVRKKVANFPDGRALLQTANHEVAESNVEYWRSMEHQHVPALERSGSNVKQTSRDQKLRSSRRREGTPWHDKDGKLPRIVYDKHLYKTYSFSGAAGAPGRISASVYSFDESNIKASALRAFCHTWSPRLIYSQLLCGGRTCRFSDPPKTPQGGCSSRYPELPTTLCTTGITASQGCGRTTGATSFNA